MADLSTDGTGHRGRLRQRLFEGGPDALLDHELVEYLLALALPRRDTKPLAKKLIHEFGGYGGLLTADRKRSRASAIFPKAPSPRSRSPRHRRFGC
jgi:DNA repair protein RadC